MLGRGLSHATVENAGGVAHRHVDTPAFRKTAKKIGRIFSMAWLQNVCMTFLVDDTLHVSTAF